MTTRSTRNKVRWQLKAASDRLDQTMHHLSLADQYTEDRAAVLTDTLPTVTLAILELQKAILIMRDEI